MTTEQILITLGACNASPNDAVPWSRAYPDPRRAWIACERPDWMLWLLGIKEDNRIAICELACDFAEHPLTLLVGDDAQTRAVCEATIETTRKFLHGKATREQLDAAAARAARAEAAAVWAARWAAEADFDLLAIIKSVVENDK